MSSALHINPALPSAAEIPTRTVAEVREQRVDALLGLRLIKEESRLAVLLRNRVILLDFDAPEWIAVIRDSIAN